MSGRIDAKTLATIVAFAFAGLAVNPSAAQSQLTVEQRKIEAYANRMMNRAENFLRSREPGKARNFFKDALDELESVFGPQDLRLVKPLRGIARTLLRQKKGFKGARGHMQRVVDIYDANGQVDVDEHAKAVADLADWWLLTRKTEEAHREYNRAWTMLAEGVDTEHADQTLLMPTILNIKPPVYRPFRQDYRERVVVVQFTVAPDGKPQEIEIVEEDAPLKLQKDVVHAFQKALYRPRVLGGEVVSAPAEVRLHFPGAGGFPRQEF